MNRFLAAVLIGLIISLALFWLMQIMVMNNQHELKLSDNLQMVEFVRLKRETKTQIKDRKHPEPPPPKKRPPPPKPMAQNNVVKNNIPDIDMPNIDIPLQSNRFRGSLINGITVGQGSISTNIMPLVRIPPRYPMRAASRRIEGWVKIEFTITETGTVKDAVVIESQPSGTFDRAALRAIAKWKFKAKIIDGEAFEQRAIQVMEFNLSK
ncbi:MAG: energy transducer TonB [Methyloprofundus sp.]|nr:energy transducer TonB [Methyloprofundus sp.]